LDKRHLIVGFALLYKFRKVGSPISQFVSTALGSDLFLFVYAPSIYANDL